MTGINNMDSDIEEATTQSKIDDENESPKPKRPRKTIP